MSDTGGGSAGGTWDRPGDQQYGGITDELNAAGNTTQTDDPLIGIPEGYSRPPQNIGTGRDPNATGGNYAEVPQYRESDVWEQIQGMDPAQLAEVQQVLDDAGILNGQYRSGQVNDATVSAFGTLLGFANQNGFSINGALNILQSNQSPVRNGSGGSARAPFSAQAPNRADLKRSFRNAMVSLVGSNVAPDELDRYVDEFSDYVVAQQRRAYTMAPTGGVQEQTQSADGFIQDKLEQDFGAEVGANNVAERAGSLINIITGSIG